jgi:hypothetical protein
MTIPAMIAPINPLVKTKISTKCSASKSDPNFDNDVSGAVKYSKKLTLSTIKITIIGYIKAITHVERKTIFNRNPIPKNKIRNRTIDINNCGKFTACTPMSFLSLLNTGV